MLRMQLITGISYPERKKRFKFQSTDFPLLFTICFVIEMVFQIYIYFFFPKGEGQKPSEHEIFCFLASVFNYTAICFIL